MAKALTVRMVEQARPAEQRREIPDGLLAGLYLVIQPSGGKSWAVRYRFKGQPRKHTLGSFPALDLVNARKLASKALRAVAEGRDPSAEKQEARTGKPDTVATVVADFVEHHCKRNNRPRTAQETERLLRLHVLPHWRNRPIQSITRRDVHAILDRVIAGGAPVAANRTLAAVRLLFNWALARDIVTASPCAGIKRPTEERSRDRTLSDGELGAVWQAAKQVGAPFGVLVQLLVLTGARRDEVARMRWGEVDLEKRVWMLPRERVKNDRAHQVPLSAPAIAILQALPRINGSDFVLTTNGRVAASDFGKKKRRLDMLLPPDMAAWTLHDIRRSVASGLQRLGVRTEVIERALNHTSGSFGGVAGIYQRDPLNDDVRAGLERWGDHVERLVSGTPAQIVALRPAAQ